MADPGSSVARRARPVMGTMASVHVHDDASSMVIDAAIDDLFAELDRLEAIFSTFRPTSEISRVNRGALDLAACSPEVIDVLDACTWLESASNGAFDIRPQGLAGPLDPAGFVKGWATERASARLREHGLEHWYVSVGGDITLSGAPEPGQPWRVGLADPNQPGAIRAWLDVAEGAVATSGTAERGAHLWDRRPGTAPSAFAAVTVLGPSLTWADAFATTVFVMGEDGFEWLAEFEGYAAVAIRADGSVAATAGVAEAVAR